MITAQEGYLRLLNKHPLEKIDICLDMGVFWLYMFRPIDMKDGETNLCGTIFDAIRKRDGKYYLYDISSKPNVLKKAKKVEIKDFYDAILK